MLLVLFANNMSSIKYSSLFGMKKGIEFKYLLLYALVYVLFVLGYLLSKKYKIKSNIMDDYYREYIDKSLSGLTDLDFTLLFELMNSVQSSLSKDNKKALEKVFKKYHPQIVINAAAHKHVPLMEENPCEAVLVNVTGSRQVADMAVEYGAEKMIMVSTDKAVNPTNVMGCSKRLAEIYVQSLGCAIRELSLIHI